MTRLHRRVAALLCTLVLVAAAAPVTITGQLLAYQDGFVFFTTGDGFRVAPNVTILDEQTKQPAKHAPVPRDYARAVFNDSGQVVETRSFEQAVSGRAAPRSSASLRRDRFLTVSESGTGRAGAHDLERCARNFYRQTRASEIPSTGTAEHAVDGADLHRNRRFGLESTGNSDGPHRCAPLCRGSAHGIGYGAALPLYTRLAPNAGTGAKRPCRASTASSPSTTRIPTLRTALLRLGPTATAPT